MAVTDTIGRGSRPVRIANCSGFYGDRLSAAREMVEGGPIDVLTGDYLAELTMLILSKARRRDPAGGYATTFLRQVEEVLGTCIERGIRIVTNAGGLNPAACAEAVRDIAARLGIVADVASIEGDDLMPDLEVLRPQLRHMDTGEELAADPVTA
ncbi:MAG: acyclic terpene utilization AtuA family protein, partial [Ilumatobacteraceae bacterium]